MSAFGRSHGSRRSTDRQHDSTNPQALAAAGSRAGSPSGAATGSGLGSGGSSGSSAPGPQQIAEEHARLRELLAELEGAEDLARVLALLGDLRGELAEHFAHEEMQGGLETVVAESAPHLAGQVDELFAEHRWCLKEVDRLRERTAALLKGPAMSLRREVAALCKKLHEHERQETELLSGALYDEIGGSG